MVDIMKLAGQHRNSPFTLSHIFAGSSEERSEGLCAGSWATGSDTLSHSLSNGRIHQPQGLPSSSRAHHHLSHQICEWKGIVHQCSSLQPADFYTQTLILHLFIICQPCSEALVQLFTLQASVQTIKPGGGRVSSSFRFIFSFSSFLLHVRSSPACVNRCPVQPSTSLHPQ